MRIDHAFGPRFRVFGRFENDTIPTTEPGGLFIGSPLPGVSTSSTNSPGRIFTIHATNVISPTLINDAGYNYSHGGVLSTPIGLTAAKNSPRYPVCGQPSLRLHARCCAHPHLQLLRQRRGSRPVPRLQ